MPRNFWMIACNETNFDVTEQILIDKLIHMLYVQRHFNTYFFYKQLLWFFEIFFKI